MALEIMKNGLAKKQNKGTISSWGRGGQDEMVPGPFQNTFLFSNPSLNKKVVFLHKIVEYKSNFSRIKLLREGFKNKKVL